ncbi:BnaA04g29700D [Brassica napus]|uniref:BnaA04g29700D protein n=1 Tax=Brassica napus TaxID=3708 RepID=A0A078JIN3_BRANA|nr:BnaA04g29700D [Brassica napus]
MSGTFLVRNIDYYKQQIYISDPEKLSSTRSFLVLMMSSCPFHIGPFLA